jgi:hypothetical protein
MSSEPDLTVDTNSAINAPHLNKDSYSSERLSPHSQSSSGCGLVLSREQAISLRTLLLFPGATSKGKPFLS